MRIKAVDERDSCWEDHDPRFRVYLFDGGDESAPSWAVETFDVWDADVLDVVTWAQEQASSQRLFAVALVAEQRPEGDRVAAERGLVWLVGTDANDSDARSRSAFQRMLRRRADAGR